jgi:CHAT domain/Restriction endonuclease
VNNEMELEIGAGYGAGNYVVRVMRAPTGGEPSGSLKLDVEDILSRLPVLEATVLASAVLRRSVPVAEQPVREVGRLLFQALFTGPVYGMYRASLAVVQERGTRLRLVLRLAAPELAALPWEMLFDPETDTYLCRQEPLVRHVSAPYTPDPLEVCLPLRILGLVASPRGLSPLDVGAEIERLENALARPIADGLIEVVWVREATWAEVHSQLLAGEWHVLHFVGHGDYDAGADEGIIALVGEDGRADLVEADRFADLLGEAQPTPRLVVLNSCSSGKAGAQDLISGTAAALARRGINSVVAMQFAISDTAAIAFARGFYTAIARGRGVDQAARSGRISILGTPRSLEWLTPVLYLRGQATQLFSLNAPPSTDDRTPVGHQVLTEKRSATQQGMDQQGSAAQPLGQRRQQAQMKRGEQQGPAEDRRLLAEQGMAEAAFRTETVKSQVDALGRLLQDRNRLLASRRRQVEAIFNSEGPEAFVAVLQQALATSVYPHGMQGSCAAVYRPEVRELLIEYELPRSDVIPVVEAYRYVRSMGLVQPQPRRERDIKDLYAKLIASVTLRTLAEVFDIAPETLVIGIVFNGFVSALDITSGNLIRPILISSHVTREAFAKIVLDAPELDPVACLRSYLHAIVSPRPYDLEEVRPVAQFDLSKHKFVEEMDVVAGFGSHPELLRLTPAEFEHLIRQLFEAIGLKSWVTQASMDEGVDVVAVNEDPILGGLCIIQVKRYTGAVGLAAVQALAGVVEDKRAAKGILVTTSWASKAGHDFAARHGRIQIIEGRELKHMLREHLGIDVRINLPKPPH